MKSKVLLFGAIALLAASFGMTLQAAVVVQSGTVVLSATAPLPPGTPFTRVDDANVISLDASIGQSYSNAYASPSGTNAFVPGDTNSVRVVGSDILTNYNLRTGGSVPATFTVVGGASAGTYNLVAIFALDGTQTAGAASVFTATSGRIGLFAVPLTTPSSYNQFNPNTWGATDTATGLVFGGGALPGPIAVWDLIPPDVAIDLGPAAAGGGGPGTYNGLLMNNSVTLNSGSTQLQQGLSIFIESTTWPTAGATAALIGNTYDNIFNNPPLAAPPEGLVATLNEVLNTAPGLFAGDALTTAGLAALNTIAASLGGFANIGGAGTAFATGQDTPGDGTGAVGLYAPSTSATPGSGLTADLQTNVGLQASIFGQPVEVIPEPASMIVWALGLFALGGYRLRRGRRT